MQFDAGSGSIPTSKSVDTVPYLSVSVYYSSTTTWPNYTVPVPVPVQGS